MGLGHLSVLEHASFTFSIKGISRICSHQLVRHRIASYSQQSQRAVRLEGANSIVVPDSIAKKNNLLKRFRDVTDRTMKLYKEMIDSGVPKEDARFILPNGIKTNIVVTMDARTLLNFFELRLSEHAQWEIREMAAKILVLCKSVAPTIFERL